MIKLVDILNEQSVEPGSCLSRSLHGQGVEIADRVESQVVSGRRC